MKSTKSHKHFSSLVVVAILAIGLILLTVLELTNTIDFIHKAPSQPTNQVGTTPSPTAPNQKKSNTNSKPAEGSIKDTNGQTSASSPDSQWTVAKTGLITLKLPANNATFTSGSIVSGTAKVSQVQYRLVDDNVGVLAMGPLGVSGGKFSGILQFQHSASTGRLDIFSFNNNGVEVNEITVRLNF